MYKRILAVFITIGLLCMNINLNIIHAQSQITLNDVQNKVPGDYVEISGSTTLDSVVVKVLRPSGAPLYYNVLKCNGDFEDRFKLPETAESGIYTAIVGKDADVAIKSFNVDSGVSKNTISDVKIIVDNVKKSVKVTGKISASGESVNIKVINPLGNMDYVDQTNSDREGKFSFEFTPFLKTEGDYTVVLGGKGVGSPFRAKFTLPKNETPGGISIPTAPIENTKIVVIDTAAYDKLLKDAKADGKGVKKISYEVKYNDEGKYAVRLPKNSVAADNKGTNAEFHLITPIGTLLIPDNLFNSRDIKADTVDFSICIKVENGKNVIAIASDIKDSSVKLNYKSPLMFITKYEVNPNELKNTDFIIANRISKDGKLTPVVNSRFDSTERNIKFAVGEFGNYIISYNKKTFEDTSTVKWAEKPIEFLSARGVIKGFSESNCGPARKITRADFVCMLVRSLGIDIEVTENFSDVKENAYYYREIGIARELGIVSGVGSGRFIPEKNISRQDMMTIIYRTLDTFEKISKPTATIDKKYKDANKVSGYAMEGVATLINEGIIVGNNHSLLPGDNATRAETAVMLYKILTKYILD